VNSFSPSNTHVEHDWEGDEGGGGYFCSIVLLRTAPGEVALDQVTHRGCQCGRDEGEGCEDVGCELHSVFFWEFR